MSYVDSLEITFLVLWQCWI